MAKCGGCTFCCTMSVVPELNKGVGQHCVFCSRGCMIHGRHPKSCKEFNCAWVQHRGKFSTKAALNQYRKLRPDKCGIMFFKKSDRIFCGVLMPNKEVKDIAKLQIEDFKKQGYSVILLKIGEYPHVLPANGYSKTEIYKEYIEILEDGNV